MCRMFAYIGKEPQEIKPHFVDGNNSLIRQALRNPDGWGVVFQDRDGSIVKKHESCAAHQSCHFRDLCKQVSSRLVIAHLRYATVGMIIPENVHPFVKGKWVFAHNGSVFKFTSIKEELLSSLPEHLKLQIQGSTDSEHLFMLILWEIEKLEGQRDKLHSEIEHIAWAIKNVITQVNDLALTAGAHGDSLMNILLTNGSTIWGTRFGKPLVYYHDPAHQGVVIATERTDKKRKWKTFPQNIVFAMTPEGSEMQIYPLLERSPKFGAIDHTYLSQCLS